MDTKDQASARPVRNMAMKRVIIESPYAGDVEANVEYARRCVRDSVLRGEAPIASHLLFTQPGILRDDVEEERALGIAAGLAWRDVADYSVFYTDRGWSRGMLAALDNCLHEERLYKFRVLVPNAAIQVPFGYKLNYTGRGRSIELVKCR